LISQTTSRVDERASLYMLASLDLADFKGQENIVFEPRQSGHAAVHKPGLCSAFEALGAPGRQRHVITDV
jgi:hypothetical protein